MWQGKLNPDTFVINYYGFTFLRVQGVQKLEIGDLILRGMEIKIGYTFSKLFLQDNFAIRRLGREKRRI